MFVDKLFLAAGGVSMESGISYAHFIDLHVKRAMIDAAKTVYLLADSKKFGTRVRGFRRDGSHRLSCEG